jgi:type I restriction enzyme S subunit
MASDWQLKTIAECASNESYSTQIGPFGKALMANEYTETGIPVLRGVNVNFGRFHDDDYVFVSEEMADKLSKFESYPGDVLLVHKGSLGKIGLMPKKRKYKRYIMGNSMMRVKCDPTKLLPEYLYYWLSSGDGQQYIFSRVSQVGVPQLQTPLTTLRQASLPIPSIDEQRAIVDILGSLDEALERNQKMNQTLESMTRAIFKSWFVDFDPVRAKAEGREPEGMDADTAALFPTKLKDSELGEIPRDWNIECFDKAVDITSGGTPKTSKSEYWGGDIPWFSIVDAPAPSDVFVIETEKLITNAGLASCSARLLPVGATIISARGTVGKLAVTGVPMAINQSCYALLPKVFGTYGTFFQTGRLVDILRQFAHGAVFSTITRGTLSSIKVVVPPKAIANSFEETVGPLMDAILNCRKMSKTLTDLRDTLLPRLISGKLRVPEAEAMLMEVV